MEHDKWCVHSYAYMPKEAQMDFYGHMHNLAYLQAFEEARWQMITERGYGFDVIQGLQAGPVVLSIETKFRKEVLLRQKVIIESFGISYHGKVGRFRQQMISQDGGIHCEADFSIALFDIKQRKLVNPSDAWLRACGNIELLASMN